MYRHLSSCHLRSFPSSTSDELLQLWLSPRTHMKFGWPWPRTLSARVWLKNRINMLTLSLAPLMGFRIQSRHRIQGLR